MTFPEKLYFVSSEEVADFEANLDSYLEHKGSGAFPWISLEKVWKQLKEQGQNGRLFAALIDLRLAVLALQQELNELRQLLQPTDDTPKSAKLFDRLELYRTNTSFILRYRAILDKLMGAAVIAWKPSKYDSFRNARSRKKMFLKLFTTAGRVAPGAQSLADLAAKFDQRFRTAEAHDTGTVRTWVFAEVHGADTIQADMFWAWNNLHPILTSMASELGYLR